MNEIQLAAFELRKSVVASRIADGESVAGALLAVCSTHADDPEQQIEIIDLLLAAGAHLQECDGNGVTSLHRAVRFRHVAAVKALLERGADPNAVDRRSHATPLHRAVTSTGAPGTPGKILECIQIIQTLIAKGADPAAVNRKGKTPLDYAKNGKLRAALLSATRV